MISFPQVSQFSRVSPPQWSADGSRLAGVVYEDGEFFAKIVTLGDRSVRRLQMPGGGGSRLNFSWSPDESWFAYVDAGISNAEVSQNLAHASVGWAIARRHSGVRAGLAMAARSTTFRIVEERPICGHRISTCAGSPSRENQDG